MQGNGKTMRTVELCCMSAAVTHTCFKRTHYCSLIRMNLHLIKRIARLKVQRNGKTMRTEKLYCRGAAVTYAWFNHVEKTHYCSLIVRMNLLLILKKELHEFRCREMVKQWDQWHFVAWVLRWKILTLSMLKGLINAFCIKLSPFHDKDERM